MIPEQLHHLFWEHDVASLDWDRHRTFIIERILRHGRWADVVWLRDRIGDAGLRQWLLDNNGRGLEPRQLRYWELILELPPAVVDGWVAEARKQPWHRRSGRDISH